MGNEIRESGIGIIGDVPWGTHFCQFFKTREDLINILVPYFKAGLENNELCIWAVSKPLNPEDAKAALKKKVKNLDRYIKKAQIEIVDSRQHYTKSGVFEAERVLEEWIEKEQEAIRRGFDGLRVSGNTFWLGKKDWKNFKDYEKEVDKVIGQHRMLAICLYSLEKCGALEVLDIVSNHQFALAAHNGNLEIIESTKGKRLEKMLRESEERYKNTLDNMMEGCQIIGYDWRYLYVNDAVARHGRTKKENLMGKKMGDVYPGIEKTKMFSTLKRCMKERTSAYLENEFEYPNGERGWFELSIQPVPEGLFILSIDITSRKNTEGALRKVNRKLKMLSQCNQVIIRAKDESKLMEDICHKIVMVGGYRLIWVGMAVEDEQQSVKPVAQAGYEEGYLDKIKISWADTEQGRGPTGIAIRTGKSSVLQNIQGDPNYAPWRDEAVKRGYASSVALPLIVNGSTIGALNIYAEEPFAFDATEMKLLSDLASDLSFGIKALRAQARQRKMDQKILHLNRVYSVLSSINEAIIRIRSRKKLFDKACRIAVKQGLFRLAWIGIIDEETHEIKVAAKQGIDEGYLKKVNASAAGFKEGNGPAGNVIRKGKYFVCNDIETDEQMLAWREEALKRGYRSCAAFPLRVFGRTVGNFSLYAAEINFFDAQEIRLLQELSSDLSYAIEFMAREEQRKKSEVQLKASLEEKDVMMSEIHHRVKNNMQIIMSLLRLKARHTDDPDIKNTLQECQNRIKAMALVHESLYQFKDLARIEFRLYLDKLIPHLLSIYIEEAKKVQLNLDIKDVYLDVNRAIPCALIINELVTNAMIHAFTGKKKGNLTVSMARDEKDTYKLLIRDNGVGLPQNINVHNPETLGMQLISDLVQQLNGTIKVERKGGTIFRIAFSI